MKLYELVCVIDAWLSSAEITDLRKKIEKLVSIKETDDMGLLPLAYPLNGNDQAYFLSYAVEMDNDMLSTAKTELKLMKWLAKFFFYTMKSGESFMKFSELQKRYDDLVKAEEERMMKNNENTEDEEQDE